MNDKERLIEILRNGFYISPENEIKGTVQKAADYLIANGVFVLPCKIGERVYCIMNHNSEIVEDVVDDYDIWSVKDGIKLRLSLRDYDSYVIAEFGKTVFLTREEAEAALDKENKHGHCL